MIELREIVRVKANDDFTLECEMENGEIYLYDLSFINTTDGDVTNALRDINLFKQVWLDDIGALEWSTGFGIHGDTVAREGRLVKKSA